MIEIVTEKLVEQGEKMRKIIAIEGVMENKDLPTEYLKGYPRIQNDLPWETKGLSILSGNEERCEYAYSLHMGSVYTEEYFRAALKVMYAAGDRLHQLRQKEKELKKTWRGDETFLV